MAKQPSLIDLGAFVKKYPGQEQVDLGVVVQVPNHWFTEQLDIVIEATAVEFSERHSFGTGRQQGHHPAIRFQCNNADPEKRGIGCTLMNGTDGGTSHIRITERLSSSSFAQDPDTGAGAVIVPPVSKEKTRAPIFQFFTKMRKCKR